MSIKSIDGLRKRVSVQPEPVLITAEKIYQENKEKIPEKFEQPKKKNTTFKAVSFIIVFLIILGITLYLSRLLFYKNEGGSLLEALSKINIIKEISNLITSGDKKLAGENDDRINFLLLGIGGEGHDGPYLTDTIILASLKPSEKKVAMVSIPRDLLVEINPNNWQKINAVYTYGRLENKNDGLTYTKEIIEKNFGLPIHYYFLIDFKGFEKIIDTLGGIEVNVEQSFADNAYPLTADPPAWQTVSFQAGKQKMDGETALKFARSRHGNNGEGSDFARAKRQQKIILAVKDKIFSFETLLRPTRVSGLFTMLNNSFQTNIKSWEVMKLYDLIKDLKDKDVLNLVLDDSPNNYLYSSILEDGTYALLPKGGNFSAIQSLLTNIFQTSQIREENAYLEILNGTKIEGLAYQTALALESFGLKIKNYANAKTQDYQTTIIYDLTNGQKNKSLEIIRNQVGGYVTTEIPNYIKEEVAKENPNATENNQAVDFVIILGQDQLIK